MATPKRKNSQESFSTPSAEDGPSAEVIAIPMPEYQPERSSRQQPPRIGEILKRERERRGYDLQQIADYLCIRRGLLSALESSRYEDFPADAYVIGFLRSYAELIGLNGQEAITLYRQEMAGRRRAPDLVMPTPISEGHAPTAVIMGAAAAAALLIYVMWYAFSSSDRASVSAPPPLPTAESSTTTTTTAPPPMMAPAMNATQPPVSAGIETVPNSTPSGIAISGPAPAQTLTPAPASDASVPYAPPTPVAAPAPVKTDTAAADVNNDEAAPPPPTTTKPAAATTTTASATAASTSGRITIKADQSSWVLVSNAKGQTIYDHVMRPGETYEVPNFPGLTLTAGNGAGIVLSLDGVDLPRLSNTTSHIVRNVPLEAGALRALPAHPAE